MTNSTEISSGDPDPRRWMARARELAQHAAAEGEVPVGAVLVSGGRLLAEGFNRTLRLADPTAHAEVLALRRAAARLGNHRISGATLFTTLEPCLMCFGAILEARVSRLVFGARDPRRGAISLWNSGSLGGYPAPPVLIVEQIEEESCRGDLQDFFRDRRSR
jgi:tRNA(adenine34) deaminase